MNIRNKIERSGVIVKLCFHYILLFLFRKKTFFYIDFFLFTFSMELITILMLGNSMSTPLSTVKLTHTHVCIVLQRLRLEFGYQPSASHKQMQTRSN